VELKSVLVRPLDPKYSALAGPEFLKTAKAPLSIEVRTARSLGIPARNAAPVILLNDERLMNTHAVAADRLVAFVSDRERLRDVNTVAVVWLGEAAPTKTRRPLTFRPADIRE